MSTLLKTALVLYMLATAATGALSAFAIAVDAWPLAMAIIAVWMFGWSPLVIVGYAELERRLDAEAGAGPPAQTSVGRHRADGPADPAGDQVERFHLLEELAS